MMIRGDQELLLTQEQTNGLTVELSCVGYKKKANSYTYHSRLFCLIKAYYSIHSRSSFSWQTNTVPFSPSFYGFSRLPFYYCQTSCSISAVLIVSLSSTSSTPASLSSLMGGFICGSILSQVYELWKYLSAFLTLLFYYFPTTPLCSDCSR